MVSKFVRAMLVAGAMVGCVPVTAWSQTADSLSIAGVPATTVKVGAPYSFTPRAVAVGPIAPRFEVENLPRWASFGWAGQLSGTPAAADAGVYPNIVVSIVAGEVRASLPVFAITVKAAGSVAPPVTLTWTPPTTNADGSVLRNLAGYRIYMGSAADNLHPLLSLENAGLSRYVLEGLSSGLHYFAITAVNTEGEESKLSEVVDATLE